MNKKLLLLTPLILLTTSCQISKVQLIYSLKHESDERDVVFSHEITTYERGVGFTKACGTGSCSSFIVSHLLNLVDEKVTVKQELGSLKITKEEDRIYMEGPSVKVGEIII